MWLSVVALECGRDGGVVDAAGGGSDGKGGKGGGKGGGVVLAVVVTWWPLRCDVGAGVVGVAALAL